MTFNDLNKMLSGKKLDGVFSVLYPGADKDSVYKRYSSAVASFADLYGTERDITLFSVPGRSELCGNHTDHNHGKVIAGSIDLDIIAVASPTDDGIIKIKSEGFPEDCVDLSEYTSPKEDRFGKSDALIAGVASGFVRNGHKVGGLVAYTTSNVLKGSGLSSSAAFEDMVGNILNHLYNDGKIDYVEISQISQYSENKFFGKPCGLMDQVACAAGGIVTIDFADTDKPVVRKLDFDMSKQGYCLCITDTGGNHADLTPDYASVPAEMKAVAALLGKEFLRQTDEDTVIANAPDIRAKLGDRALMRAIHFFEENKRVDTACASLDKGNTDLYMETIKESGRSSFCYLQNVYTTVNIKEQGLSLALCLTEKYFGDNRIKSAYRVHGGGFAGTIQAYVPQAYVDGYKALLDSVFGAGSCHVLHIRSLGAVKVI